MLFNDFGELVDIKLHDNIAHIEFKHYYDAIEAMNTYDGQYLDGKLLRIELVPRLLF
jgi:RNA recognition motif-containing protein